MGIHIIYKAIMYYILKFEVKFLLLASFFVVS